MANQFVEDLTDTFRGVRGQVETSNHTYEGRGGRWEYDSHAFLIYDATRDDGTQLGATLVNKPETVERLAAMAPIEDVPVALFIVALADRRVTGCSDSYQQWE